MKLYESRLSYFHDKATINHCKPLSVHQHGGPSRSRQKCHSCIFETKENSNLRICIQYLGHHSTTYQKSAKSMRYRVRPKFEFYRKSLLNSCGIAPSNRLKKSSSQAYLHTVSNTRSLFLSGHQVDLFLNTGISEKLPPTSPSSANIAQNLTRLSLT